MVVALLLKGALALQTNIEVREVREVRQWNAIFSAEIGDDPEIRNAIAQGWKRRHAWPDDVKQWVASLSETDAHTWARVADLIERASG